MYFFVCGQNGVFVVCGFVFCDSGGVFLCSRVLLHVLATLWWYFCVCKLLGVFLRCHCDAFFVCGQNGVFVVCGFVFCDSGGVFLWSDMILYVFAAMWLRCGVCVCVFVFAWAV